MGRGGEQQVRRPWEGVEGRRRGSRGKKEGEREEEEQRGGASLPPQTPLTSGPAAAERSQHRAGGSRGGSTRSGACDPRGAAGGAPSECDSQLSAQFFLWFYFFF